MSEDFAESINSSGELKLERELPAQHPLAGSKAAEPEDLSVKYGRFVVGKTGCPELEQIMDDCVTGKKLLAQEKWHFTKEGDAIVVIKYFIKVPKVKAPSLTEIKGRRRLKKTLGGGE